VLVASKTGTSSGSLKAVSTPRTTASTDGLMSTPIRLVLVVYFYFSFLSLSWRSAVNQRSATVKHAGAYIFGYRTFIGSFKWLTSQLSHLLPLHRNTRSRSRRYFLLNRPRSSMRPMSRMRAAKLPMLNFSAKFAALPMSSKAWESRRATPSPSTCQ